MELMKSCPPLPETGLGTLDPLQLDVDCHGLKVPSDNRISGENPIDIAIRLEDEAFCVLNNLDC